MILRDKFGKASESFQVCLMPVSILYIVLTPVGFTSRFGNIRTISVIINNWWTRGSIDKRTMTNTNLITLYFQSGCHVMLHMSLIYVYIYTYFQHLSFPPLCNPWDPRLGLSHGFSFRGKKKNLRSCALSRKICTRTGDLHLESWTLTARICWSMVPQIRVGIVGHVLMCCFFLLIDVHRFFGMV